MMVSERRLRRWSARVLIGSAVLALALLIVSLALPVSAWRSGRQAVEPLTMGDIAVRPVLVRRIWIDTDAACGARRLVDADDCFALLALLRDSDVTVVGISTVFGNASQRDVYATTHSLLQRMSSDNDWNAYLHAGATRPLSGERSEIVTAAARALSKAIADGPLTIVALGPLTNIAAALAVSAVPVNHVTAIIAVMGRRPGHLFHPSEGTHNAMLFGHGPVFADFNVTQDVRAVRDVVARHLPLILLPYDLARQVEVTSRDLEIMVRRGGVDAWVARRATGWLTFWREQIGRNGFFPFDLMAAAYVQQPSAFECANVSLRATNESLFWTVFWNRSALLVDPWRASPGSAATYCYRYDRSADEQTALRPLALTDTTG